MPKIDYEGDCIQKKRPSFVTKTTFEAASSKRSDGPWWTLRRLLLPEAIGGTAKEVENAATGAKEAIAITAAIVKKAGFKIKLSKLHFVISKGVLLSGK